MTTYGEHFLAELASAKDALLKLTHVTYEPTQIKDVLSAAGAKTELFLKSVALPGKNTRNKFNWFIDELPSAAISAQSVDKLHSFRRTYNDAKHEPTITIPLLDAVHVVDNAWEATKEIVAKGIGNTNAQIHPHTHRVFWIAVWDHFAHGDSEVHILLPDESEHWLGPPTFDIVYVRPLEWDEVLATLRQVGRLGSGEGLIPESQYKAFNTDDNFYGAWVFEGEYRSLITTLAQHELRQNLIPGLNRHDSVGSMIVAFLMACLDVIGGVTNAGDLDVAIIAQATSGYAVPVDYKHAPMLAEGMAEMMQQIPITDWPQITGPIWMKEAEFDAATAGWLAKHPKYDIIVDHTLSVRMLIEVRKEEQARHNAEADKQFDLQLEKIAEKLGRKEEEKQEPT